MARFGPPKGFKYDLKPHDTITKGDAVGVLLSNVPERVWVDKTDFERIIRNHGNRAWMWSSRHNFVRLNVSVTKSVNVARLVLGSDGTGIVAFADGDRKNLRRSNISIKDTTKKAGGRERKALAKWVQTLNTSRAFVSTPPTPPQVPVKFTKKAMVAVATVKRVSTPFRY